MVGGGGRRAGGVPVGDGAAVGGRGGWRGGGLSRGLGGGVGRVCWWKREGCRDVGGWALVGTSAARRRLVRRGRLMMGLLKTNCNSIKDGGGSGVSAMVLVLCLGSPGK